MKKIYLFFAMLLSSSLALFSQEINFTNGEPANANWSSSLNWSTGVIPTSTSIVNTENSATSFVDIDFRILRLQNLTNTGGQRLVNSINGAILTIDPDVANANAILNQSNSGVKLGIRGKINIDNININTFSRITIANNAANSIEFEGTSLLTLSTPIDVSGGNNFFFNGQIGGAANFRVPASTTATFGNSVSNAGYSGQFVLTGGTLIVNTADNVVFYDGPKVQVNQNSTVTLNGINVFQSGITVGAASNSRTLNLNIDKNQNGMTAIILVNSSVINLDIDPSVTNLSFANNSSNAWNTGTLNITGFKNGVIRFGTDNTGLTAGQLSQIKLNNVSANLALDANGYLYTYDTAWTGAIDTDWNTSGNWTDGVPTSGQNVYIPNGLANYPTAGSAVTVNSLILASGASLIANDAFIGNVTYNRAIDFVSGNLNGWHLVSSPVSGEDMTDMRANNTFATGSGSNIGFATYTPATNQWSYFTTSSTDALTAGKGFSAKLGSTGNLSFTGTINTADVNGVSITSEAINGYFNLVGNPYTSSINSKTFLDANTNVQATIWVWDVATNNYITKPAVDEFKVAPGQGFFVKATSGTTVNFAESNQQHNGDTFLKTSKTEVKLLMNDGSNNRFAKIYYLDNVTKGFDNGFDGETFGGIENSVDVFTNLVENNEGKKYQVQSLPIAEMETMIITVGIKAAAGKEITFTAEALNLPTDLKVFLEDRLTNTFTRLDEANSSYKVTLNDALNGTGRFFLHTKSSAVLSTDDVVLQNTSIYVINNNTLRVIGLPSGNATLKMYNILGKQVMSTSFSSTGVKDISLPKFSTGMYIIQLETASGKLNKKIVLE